nr:immunoglobulin heavy chain junction region [Mus musculus]
CALYYGYEACFTYW